MRQKRLQVPLFTLLYELNRGKECRMDLRQLFRTIEMEVLYKSLINEVNKDELR